jgi:hypothetical protein
LSDQAKRLRRHASDVLSDPAPTVASK